MAYPQQRQRLQDPRRISSPENEPSQHQHQQGRQRRRRYVATLSEMQQLQAQAQGQRQGQGYTSSTPFSREITRLGTPSQQRYMQPRSQRAPQPRPRPRPPAVVPRRYITFPAQRPPLLPLYQHHQHYQFKHQSSRCHPLRSNPFNPTLARPSRPSRIPIPTIPIIILTPPSPKTATVVYSKFSFPVLPSTLGGNRTSIQQARPPTPRYNGFAAAKSQRQKEEKVVVQHQQGRPSMPKQKQMQRKKRRRGSFPPLAVVSANGSEIPPVPPLPQQFQQLQRQRPSSSPSPRPTTPNANKLPTIITRPRSILKNKPNSPSSCPSARKTVTFSPYPPQVFFATHLKSEEERGGQEQERERQGGQEIRGAAKRVKWEKAQRVRRINFAMNSNEEEKWERTKGKKEVKRCKFLRFWESKSEKRI
ncbi:MAG: hypothetical protein M1834_003516 [Cirrosporium novae-zelandiae]|nr:MAG: hypothetical protein M1834_003516 [Cirrosporium novae-zelandiae]